MKQIIDFILNHWVTGIGISTAIYELIARLKPTGKDWSLLNKIIKIADFVIPNLERDPYGKIRFKKNILKCVILFMLFFGEAEGQLNQQAKGYYSTNALDTAFLQSTRTSLQGSNGNTGLLYFDETRNKWRVWDGSQYVNLINTAVSGVLTVSGSSPIVITGTAANPNVTVLTASGAQSGVVSTTAQSFAGKKTFTPTATDAGFSFGLLAGNPSSLVNGDAWYDQTAGTFDGRAGGTTNSFVQVVGALTATRIPYATGAATVTNEAGFTYNETTNIFTVENITLSGNPPDNNSATSLLSRNPGTGVFEERTVASILGVPAGNNQEIQFNNSGAFGADLDFTYSSAGNELTIGDPVTTNAVEIDDVDGVAISGTGGVDAIVVAAVGAADGLVSANGVLTLEADGNINLNNTGTGKVNVQVGMLPDGGGFKHMRLTTGSIGGLSFGTVLVNWVTPFSDSNYTVTAFVQDVTGGTAALSVHHMDAKSAGQVSIIVQNTNAGALTGTLNVIAIHD